MARRLIVLLSLGALGALGTLPATADDARAATHVYGTPGGVLVYADNASHDFRFLKSDVDILTQPQGPGDPEKFAEDSRSAAVTYGVGIFAVSGWIPAWQQRVYHLAAVEAARLASFIEALPPDLPPAVNEAVSDLYAELDALLTQLKAYGQTLISYTNTANRLARTSFDPEIDGSRIDTVRANLNEYFDQLRAIESGLQDGVEQMNLAREVLEETAGVPAAIKTKMVDFSLRISRLALRYSEAGFVSLGFLKALGTAGIVADIGYTFYTGTSKNRVLIEDRNGVPIVAHGLCRQVVRNVHGGTYGASVLCPSTHFPFAAATAAFSLLGGIVLSFVEAMGYLPTRGLYVFSGSGDDNIAVDLPGNQDLFRQITVYGGAGKDTIRGSDFGERLVGGDGDDTVYGKGGDDNIDGGGWILGSTGNGANDNDRLFGGRQSDSVDGELGDDLILGGPDDDWRYFGSPALFGDDGNDVIIGGPGRDSMDGGEGRDSVFAKESEFGRSLGNPTKQSDYPDYLIDCGAHPSEQYGTAGAGETAYGCSKNQNLPPFVTPSLSQILNAQPSAGSWPWYR